MNKEIWRDIKGYEGVYQISSYGRIKSLKRKITVIDKKQKRKYIKKNKEIIKKLFLDNNGYYFTTINKKRYRVHRLVATTFLPNPHNFPVVNHLDGNKLNNNISNLEWCTYKENSKHASKSNLLNLQPAINKISKKVDMYDLNNNYLKTFNSITEAKKILNKNCNCGNISEVCSGKRHSAYGYIWRFNINDEL